MGIKTRCTVNVRKKRQFSHLKLPGKFDQVRLN